MYKVRYCNLIISSLDHSRRSYQKALFTGYELLWSIAQKRPDDGGYSAVQT